MNITGSPAGLPCSAQRIRCGRGSGGSSWTVSHPDLKGTLSAYFQSCSVTLLVFPTAAFDILISIYRIPIVGHASPVQLLAATHPRTFLVGALLPELRLFNDWPLAYGARVKDAGDILKRIQRWYPVLISVGAGAMALAIGRFCFPYFAFDPDTAAYLF